jgi:tape measure domain-containing protein
MGMATVQPLHYEISADDKAFLDALVRDGRALNNLVGQAQKAGSGMEAAFKKIAVATGVAFGLNEIKSFAKEVISVRSQMQMLEQSFNVLLGSKAKADAMLGDIRDIALKSPLSLEDTAQAAQMMLSFNISAEKIIPTLRQLGDISMGNSERFRSLTLAFSQMSSAGKLMGQDLLQMINAGFNPLQIMSEKTGKSMSALRDEMSEGAISSEMVAEAFRSATAEGGKFHNMMETQASGLAGLQASLGDAWMNMLNDLGRNSEGVIESGYKATTALVENYEKVGKVLAGLIATYGTYRTAVALTVVAEKGWTVAQLAHYKVLLLLEKAQKALNLVMKANPYVLLATVVVGLVSAMWALHDSTTEEEKAQKRLDDLLNASKEKKEGLISRTDELTRKIKDETATVYEQIKAWKQLQQELPELYAKMTVEEFKQLTDEQIRHMNATAADAREMKDANKEYEEAVRKVERLKEEIRSASTSNTSGDNGGYISALAKRLKEAEVNAETAGKALSKVTEIQKEAEFQSKPASEKIAFYEEELRKLEEERKKLDEIAVGLENIEGNWKSVNIETLFSVDKLGVVNDKINKISGALGALKEENAVKKYGDAYREAGEAWRKAEAELRSFEKERGKGGGLSVEQYEAAKKAAEAAKKAYEDLGGDTGTKASEKQRKETERINELRLRAAERIAERDRALSASREQDLLDAEQKILDIEKDGFDKRMKQNELNFRKELAEIKRQADERIKAAEAYAKDLYTKETGKDEGFDFAGFDVSKLPEDLRPERIAEWVTEAGRIAGEGLAKANSDTLESLLAEYKDYTEQRKDIERKFNEDIAALQSQRASAAKAGNAALVAQLESAIAQATKNKGKELITFDFNLLKESPDYVRAFENLKNTSTETLNELLAQLEAAKAGATGVLDPTELQAYTSAIQSVIDELTSRNPFGALAAAQNELTRSSKALAEARRKLNAARKEGDPSKIAKAENEYGEALDDTTKANNRVIEAQAEVNGKMEELYESLRGIGDVIGGQAGEIINLIADIGSFATTTMSGIKTTATTAATALATIEKASAILAIISAAIQLLNQLQGLLPDAHAQYEKYAAEVAEINKLTDAVNAYKMAVIEARQERENWFADDGPGSLKDSWEVNVQAVSAYYDKLYEEQARYQDESGRGWGDWVKSFTASVTLTALGDAAGATAVMANRVKDMEKYAEGTVSAMQNLRIETRKASKGFLGSGLGGHSQKTEDLTEWARANGLGELFDENGMINEELAKTILDKYGDKLVGETKATLEELVDLKEQYDEYLEQLREYVSDLYSPLVDNMTDALWDWYDEGKDALDSFKDYASDTFRDIVSDMIKTIVLENVVGSFQDDISALYEEYSKGNIGEEELLRRAAELTNRLSGNYAAQLPALENFLTTVGDTLKDTAGIDIKQAEENVREGSKGLAASMTQDQATEMNGFLNNGLMFLRDISENTGLIYAYLSSGGGGVDSWRLLSDHAQNMLRHLSNIDGNTEYCRRLEGIEGNISNISAGIDELKTRGILLRK